MQAGFFVVILPGEAQVVGDGGAVTVRVLVGAAQTEGVAVVPTPYRDVGGVKDNTRGVQVVGVDGVEAVHAGAFPNNRDRQVAQPKGFLDNGVAFVVFADQVSGRVVEITEGAGCKTGAAFDDPFAASVKVVVVGVCAYGHC